MNQFPVARRNPSVGVPPSEESSSHPTAISTGLYSAIEKKQHFVCCIQTSKTAFMELRKTGFTKLFVGWGVNFIGVCGVCCLVLVCAKCCLLCFFEWKFSFFYFVFYSIRANKNGCVSLTLLE